MAEGQVAKRLQTELMTLMVDGAEGVSAFPSGDNFLKWTGTIKGTADSPYEGLEYRLSLSFPKEYPYKAPVVKFITCCFHPNVDLNGNICLDILKDKWSPSLTVKSILVSLQSLLGEPNNDSPLNNQAAALWGREVEYNRLVRVKYTESKA